MSTKSHDVAVVVGRFQPAHNAHFALFRRALEVADRLVVVLGSAARARDPKNPFSWQERAGMIRLGLGADAERVEFLPMQDYHDDDRWSKAVEAGVTGLLAELERPTVALVGHHKDATSAYLDLFRQWDLVEVPKQHDLHGTDIRRLYFEPTEADAHFELLSIMVPTPVLGYLKSFAKLPTYANLLEEHAFYVDYATKRFPPIYQTADMVVRANKHVLLIRRRSAPGKGLWAVPGGFVEQRETVWQAAIRELYEECGLAILPSLLKHHLVAEKRFDRPERSLRGRIITTAFYLDLRTDRLPEVAPADDALDARWVPLDQLPGSDELFEDHYEILQAMPG